MPQGQGKQDEVLEAEEVKVTDMPTETHEVVSVRAAVQPSGQASGQGDFLSAMSGALTPEEVDKRVALVQSKITALKRIRAAVLSVTSYLDWVQMKREGSNDETVPYLEENGAIKVLHVFAVETEVSSTRRVDYEHDGTYEIVVEGRVRARVFSDIWIPVIGSRWSGDPFFAKRQGQTVDPGDVRKAALTSFLGLAVREVCGLNNITWEELGEAKIDKTKVKGFQFRDNKGPAPQEVTDHKPDTNLTTAGEMKGEIVTVKIVSVNVREGEKNGKKWKRFNAKFQPEEGEPFNASTFDVPLGDALINGERRGCGAKVAILRKDGGYIDVIGVELAKEE